MNILDKINVKTIIKDHIRTLVNSKSQQADTSDWFTFFLLPSVFSFLWIWFDILLTTEYVDIIVSALSIFVGLLFNVVVILFDTIRTQKIRLSKLWVVRETISNISFSILLSIISIGLALSTQLPWGRYFKIIIHFFTYFLLLEFAITLLMVLKRMYVLFIGELVEIEKSIPKDTKNEEKSEIKDNKNNTYIALALFLILLISIVYLKK